MNWYKESKNFTSKNVINKKIRFLQVVKRKLENLTNLVFQSGSETQRIVLSFISDQRMTSYPRIRDSLIQAHSVVLDSPQRFGLVCNDVILAINDQVKILEDKRDKFDFIDQKEKVKKGWI